METEPTIYEALIHKIQDAKHHSEIPNTARALPPLVSRQLDGGEDIDQINRFINVVAEAVLLKCITLALETVATPPPAKFLFMVLGSACRKEQTIKTDQDNAIVFEDVSIDREQAVRDYFLGFGRLVCDWLHEAGYEYCEGDIMAKNPTWCQPLRIYKEYFSKWIDRIEPKAQLRFGTFFDFRGLYGEPLLETQLRKHVAASLNNSRGFFRFMAEIAVNYKAPLTRLGKLVLENDGDHKGMFHFKGAMEPFIFIARLLAYKYDVSAMNTEERFNYLLFKKVMSPEDYLLIINAYKRLMKMRIVNQIAEIHGTWEQPTNHVAPDHLSAEDIDALKQALRGFKKLQRYLKAVKEDDSWSLGAEEIKFDE